MQTLLECIGKQKFKNEFDVKHINLIARGGGREKSSVMACCLLIKDRLAERNHVCKRVGLLPLARQAADVRNRWTTIFSHNYFKRFNKTEKNVFGRLLQKFTSTFLCDVRVNTKRCFNTYFFELYL